MDAFARAANNRSIRTIQTELDFLLDASLLTPSQVSSIHALLPSPSGSTNPTRGSNSISPQSGFSNQSQPLPSPTPSPQPPVYSNTAPPPLSPAGPTPIATASALFAYTPTDAGDVALGLHDRISILEWMNADWARGRNERTGLEGIFPRSYVRVEEQNGARGGGPPPLPPVGAMQNMGLGGGAAYNEKQQQPSGSGYGNMPLDVANGQQQQQQAGGESKVNSQGKKLGKKLGNAAIFGAGASIGSNIVNGIF